jgi:hypothetical protein
MMLKARRVLVLSLFLFPGAARADFLYSGRATGAVLTVEVVRILGDTGLLPSSGGVREIHLPSGSFPPLFSSGSIDAVTQGMDGAVHSTATEAEVSLVFQTTRIEARLLGVQATAASSPEGVPVLSGSSSILGLTINGQSIVATGEPNQTIQLPTGRVVLNEQRSSLTDATGEITVNALHVYVSPVVDFVLSSAHADLTSLIPEPSTLTLLALGTLGLLGYAWRRRKRAAA